MNDASSPARNSAAAASSVGRPHRCIGTFGRTAPGGGSSCSADAGTSPVHVMPGQIAFTRMFAVAYSSAAVFVSWITPAFAAEYTLWPFITDRPTADAVLMIE